MKSIKIFNTISTVPTMHYALCTLHYALAFLLLFVALDATAKTRSDEQLKSIAMERINQSLSGKHKAPRTDAPALLSSRNGIAVYGYAGGGYAVMATDDAMPEVLGYSTTTFDESLENDNFMWWLNVTEQAVEYYTQKGEKPVTVRPDTSRYPEHVLPMMTSEWGQEEPYNNMCPVVYDGQSLQAHCLVGCVATALSQIMYYHKSAGTPRGSATVGVPHDNPKEYYTVDFGELSYDWDNMLNTYSLGNYTPEEAQAVAELCYSVGVAVDMMYDIAGSGAMSEMALVGLHRNFGLPETCRFYGRTDYTENNAGWMNIIFKELAEGRPLFYTGSDFPAGGHAFVFDGYDSEGRVHVNWGWYGRFDGFYSVDLLNPNIYNFQTSQDMIVGIEPVHAPSLRAETLNVDVPGTLMSMLNEKESIGELTITGTLDDADFEAIRSCEALQTLDLSAVTLATNDSLPSKALYGCASLQMLVLPNSMKAMGDGALAACPNINILQMPKGDGVKYKVMDDVVYNEDYTELLAVLPTRLETVDVAEGVTVVHPYAFEGCKRVRIVTLPSTLESIGEKAFANMPIIRELHVNGGVPAQVGVRAFENIDPGFLHLYIPAGLYDEYSHAAGWSKLFKSNYVTEVGTTIKARNMVRKVGEENPLFTYEIFGDNLTTLSPVLTCDAKTDSPAGTYPIHVSLDSSVSGVTLVDGVLIVEPMEGGSVYDSNSNGIADCASPELMVVSRNSLSGTKIDASAHGVQIVRYADGSIRKILR